MTRTTAGLTTILLFLQYVASAQFASFDLSSGKIVFTSIAPLEMIEAESNKLKGVVNSSDNRFAFSIEVKTFEGFNSALQREHFNENYLESEKFPKAVFTGKIIEKVDFTKTQKITVRAKGTLELHGISVERIIPVELEIRGNSIKCHSTFNVNLADHRIAIPKIVYQKIAEVIRIDIDIVLTGKN